MSDATPSVSAPDEPSRRNDLLVVSLALTMAAVLIAVALVGFRMRDAEERNDRSSEAANGRDVGGRAAASGVLDLAAESIAFSATTLRAPAGTVTIRIRNQDDGIPHNLHVNGGGVDAQTGIEAGPVEQQLTVDVGAGTYTFVCDVHPQQMSGQLTVTGATS